MTQNAHIFFLTLIHAINKTRYILKHSRASVIWLNQRRATRRHIATHRSRRSIATTHQRLERTYLTHARPERGRITARIDVESSQV